MLCWCVNKENDVHTNGNSKSDVDIAVYGCEDFARFSLDVEDEVWTLLKFDVANMDGDVSEELINLNL